MKRQHLPAAIAVSMLLSGCYINRSSYDPYSAAPNSPTEFWTPPKKALKKPSDLPPTLASSDIPMTLAEVIDIALKNNTQTRTTWAEARQSAALYGQTQSPAFPQINGKMAFTRYKMDVTFNNSTETFFQSQWGPDLSLSYIIFDFGQRRATSEAARQALFYADWTHNYMIQTVIDQVTNDYYSYLYQRELLIALEADVSTAQLTLDEAMLGLKTGVRDISDVLQARTQLLQRQTELVNQTQQVTNSYATLLTAMGIPSNISIKLEELPEKLPSEEIERDVNEIIAEALQQRNDLLAAEANLRSAELSVTAARKQFFPTIQYNFDLGRTYFSGGFNDNYHFTSAFALSFPIFTGFYLENSVRLAQAQKEQAEAQLRQTQLQVIESVVTAQFNVKVAFEALNYAQGFLESAQEQLRVSLSQYRQGTTQILNLVSAQSSLADARARKAQAIQQWFSSLVNLAYASGSLNPSYPSKFMQDTTPVLAEDSNPIIDSDKEGP